MTKGNGENSSGCCGPAKSPCCPAPEKRPGRISFRKIDSRWTWHDRLGAIRCRLGSFRDGYRVSPGLYALGEPDKDSEVFVSANYALSFNRLRRALKGLDAWVLALDTKGINVWCAAGKGTFGTDELVDKIEDAGLKSLLSHRRVIVPQLGAPGVSAHEVKDRTGFKVLYGPVRAEDIPEYLKAGHKKSARMRKVEFGLADRIVLTPVEMIPALKGYLLYAAITLAFFGLGPSGVDYSAALSGGLRFLALGLASVLAGSFVTPALLPYIPFRAFAVKGWIAGLAATAIVIGLFGPASMPMLLAVFSFVFFPLASSYIALQFTGASTFTGISGVKKELKFALPVYIAGAAAGVVILAVFKISGWGAP